jgi:hypothetical protein
LYDGLWGATYPIGIPRRGANTGVGHTVVDVDASAATIVDGRREDDVVHDVEAFGLLFGLQDGFFRAVEYLERVIFGQDHYPRAVTTR